MTKNTSQNPTEAEEYQFEDHDFLVTRNDADARIYYVNPAFARVSGYSIDELQGAPSNLLYHPDMPEQVSKDFPRCMYLV